jgi:nucleoside-diphosphate-sugar epimerase
MKAVSMRTIVIGGAGYVGSAVVAELHGKGHDVTVFDRMLFGAESMVPYLSQPRFRLCKGDIRDADAVAQAVKGHDAVVLLAAIVGEPACNRDKDLARQTNLDGAMHVLDAAKAAGVARFVFASTCSNYGVADTSKPVSETAPLNPISVYSETKVEAERRILAANGTLTPTVLRLSTAFGISARMRFDLMVSDFTLAAVRDRKVMIYGEQYWRPFVHVNDIATAIRMTLDADAALVKGEVFNVGGDANNVTKLTLGEMVRDEVPEAELAFVQQNQDPRSYRVDFTKVKQVLGFEPKWSIRDGVRELRDALRADVWPDPMAPKYRN